MADAELRSTADLRTRYRAPSGGAVDKVIDRLDHHCVEFLAASPFMVLSSAAADGVCDGSPKGGRPGFVEALDEHHVAWADLSGNNRLDSFENIVTNPSVALLCFDPRVSTRRSGSTVGRRSRSPTTCATGSPWTARRRRWWSIVERRRRPTSTAPRPSGAPSCGRPSSWADQAEELPDGRCIVRDHARIEAPLDGRASRPTTRTSRRRCGDPANSTDRAGEVRPRPGSASNHTVPPGPGTLVPVAGASRPPGTLVTVTRARRPRVRARS